MNDERESWSALACMIKESARLDPNPNIGRVMPKGWEHKERYE